MLASFAMRTQAVCGSCSQGGLLHLRKAVRPGVCLEVIRGIINDI